MYLLRKRKAPAPLAGRSRPFPPGVLYPLVERLRYSAALRGAPQAGRTSHHPGPLLQSALRRHLGPGSAVLRRIGLELEAPDGY